MEAAKTGLTMERTGLEDVVQSVRALARATRAVGLDAGQVLERELAMAITISERLRDSTISREALEKSRQQPLAAALRRDAHRALDLVADAAGVAVVSSFDLLGGFIDERRTESR